MNNKCKIIVSFIGVVASVALLIVSTVLAENKIINTASADALVVVSVILVFAAVFYATKIDYETGVYECRKCGHTFKPTFKAYIWGEHILTTRYLKCPKCNDKSWCIINKRY